MQSPTPGDSLTMMRARYPYLFVMRRSDSSVIHGTMDSEAHDRMQINGRAFPRGLSLSSRF